MITSFGDRATEALFNGGPKREYKTFPPAIVSVAVRKLDLLNAAAVIGDLRSPPGNRLEALEGDLAGLHSLRVNDPWRLVFRWEGSEAFEVRITDYH